MSGGAPEILRPPDPYGLIGNNWPWESAEEYDTAHMDADNASLLAGQAAGYAGGAAGDVGLEMSGQTATNLADHLDGDTLAFRREVINYTTAATWMRDAAADVREAKRTITNYVNDGTEEIADAEAEEASGKTPETSSADLKTQYRNKISSEKAKLDGQLDGIGGALAGSPDAPTAPTHVFIPTQPQPGAPAQPPPAQQVAAHTGGREPGQPAPPQKELPPIQHADQPGAQHPGHPGHHGGAPSMPGAPGSPSAGSPGTGGLGGSGGLGNPSGGLGGQGCLGGPNSMNPGTMNPLGIGGNNPANSPGAGTGTGAPAGSASGTGSPASALGDASLAGGLAGLSGLAGAAGPALSGIPLAGAAGAPSAAAAAGASPAGPAVPTGTGATPGMSAPLGPLGPSGGSVTPVPPGVPSGTPGTAGTPGTPGAPATPPVAAPGPGQTAGPAPAPKVDGTAMGHQAWVNASTTKAGTAGAPLVGVAAAEEEKRPAADTTYVAGLPEAERTAHLTLAALRLAYGQAGWQQPLAVAVLADDAGQTSTLFATADGLSIVPRGALLPAGMIPLSDHPNRPGVGLLGYADPAAKLVGLPGLVALVSSETTSQGTVQTPEQAVDLIEAEAAPTGSVQRGDGTDPSQAPVLVAQAVAAVPAAGDPEAIAPYLRGMRWVSEQPARYLSTFAGWLVAEALTAYQTGELTEASWLAQQALDLLGGDPAVKVGDAS